MYIRKTLLLLFLLTIIAQNNFGQTKDSLSFRFVFLPKGLSFLPLKAGIDEPRMGLLYYSATSNLKVDIGNSVDVLGFDFPESKSRITIGAEFMAYAYVTSYLEYRLQIDAIDGFFGGNIIYSKDYDWGRMNYRFRYIHNSAHLVDGHWNATRSEWMDNQYPSAYGNNYGELLAAPEQNIGASILRYYGGLAMSTGKKTGDKQLKRILYKAGFEYSIPGIFGKVFNKDESIFIAVNLDIKGIPNYIVNQNYLFGIKLGAWRGKGLVFYASYYNGGDVFNQYFTQRVSRFGIGFMIDFI